MGHVFDWRSVAVAQSPDDLDFEKAGVWRLRIPKEGWQGVSDMFLEIHYVGDAGRLYDGTHLLDDNFFNGTTWEIGLKRFEPDTLAKGVDLKILPLRKDAPIYLPKSSWPEFHGKSGLAEVQAVTISPEYEVTLTSR